MRWLIALLLVIGTGSGVRAGEPESGRTDGSEGSEYGRGGYRHFRTEGRFYVEGLFGAASVVFEPEDGSLPEKTTTDLVSGINGGYLIEDWLGFQLGYSHISGDSPANLFSAGIRNSLNLEPFNYFFTLDAELYSPDGGSDKFGIAPGVGAEMMLHERLQVGLRYQHDFIFSDDAIGINRFTARLQYNF